MSVADGLIDDERDELRRPPCRRRMRTAVDALDADGEVVCMEVP